MFFVKLVHMGIFPLARYQGEALMLFKILTIIKTCSPGRAERAGRHDFMQDVEFADGQKNALKRKIRRLITFYIMAHSSSSAGKAGYGQ